MKKILIVVLPLTLSLMAIGWVNGPAVVIAPFLVVGAVGYFFIGCILKDEISRWKKNKNQK